MLVKYTQFETLEVISVPKSAGHQRLARLRAQGHRHNFDYTPRPGYIYVRSRAISSRCNDNFDMFPAEEIKTAYRSFIGKPVFVNHKNSNHRRSRGVIIDAALHEDTNPDGTPDTWAEVLMEVDAIKFPVLAREVEAGNIARTSMGTDVQYSVCTACGNKAYTPADYCAHIPKMKGMKIHRTLASGQKQEVLVAEVCYGLGFFENSLLVEPPADPTAYVLGVESTETMSKAASLQTEAGQCVECNPSLKEAGAAGVLCNSHAFQQQHGAMDFPSHNFPNPGFSYPVQSGPTRYASAVDTLLQSEGFSSRRDIVDNLSGNKDHGEQTRRTRTNHSDDDEDYSDAVPIKHNQNWGLGGEQHQRDVQNASTREFENEHRELWRQNHPNEQYQRTPEEQRAHNRVSAFEALMQAEAAMDTTSAWRDDPEVQNWRKSRENVTYTDGSRVKEGDHIRYHQAPGGLLPAGDWRYGVAVADHDNPGELVLEDPATGRRYMLYSHIIERAEKTASLDTLFSLAYGEQKAPAKVDTMRAEACPVCGDGDAYNGEQCNVCGYTQPPSQFQDPDLGKAKEMDLRQEQQDQNGLAPEVPGEEAPQVEDLQCTNCGEVFSAEGDAATGTEPESDKDPATTQEADPEHPDAPKDSDGQKADRPDDLSDLADIPDEELLEDEKDPDEAEEDHVDQDPSAKGESRVTPDGKQPPLDTLAPPKAEDPMDDQPPVVDTDPLVDEGEIAPNATCPICGAGTLVPVAVPEDINALDQQDDPTGAPPPEKSVPPKNSSRHGAGGNSKETSRVNQPNPQNPAQERRSRMVAAIKEQQGIIDRQGKMLVAQRGQIQNLTTAIASMAVAAGLEKHATFAPLVRAAGLIRIADSAQNPEGAPATTTEEAKKPQATDDVNNVGAAPAAANQDVTPAAVTDVQNSNVAANPPVLDNLQDVTKPVPGTDAVVPAAGDAAGTSTVTVGTPSMDTFDSKGPQWTAAMGNDTERFMASLRLARLQIEAGLATGEDLTVGQAIASSTKTMAEITASVETLEGVRTAAAAAPVAQQQRTRGLVPRAAARGVQPVASQPSMQSQGAVTSRPGEDEWAFGSVE